jgi:exodeoxyribonuclease VII large subunit
MLFDDTHIYTVSELNAEVRSLLEGEYPEVSVVGEVSNFKRHTSGHLYFTLKDAEAQLRSVCFRGDAGRLTFEPADGLQVVVHGRVTLYENYGQYQLVAATIEEAGSGALELAFQRLKEALEAEGLFDPARKKPLPRFPFRVGVITSPTGAAIRDIVSTLRRRWPCVEILICPVRVQGETAAPEIARALDRLSDRDDIDLVIVGRGGGSLEDLWAFNEEIVARAIHRCSRPTISAVGHETDFTIADFVADARAATPTAAAEIAVPDVHSVRATVDEALRRLTRDVRRRLDTQMARVGELLRSYALGQVRGRIERLMQNHDYVMEKLHERIQTIIHHQDVRLQDMTTRLRGLDPKAVLGRGYAICEDSTGERVIRTVDSAVRAGSMRVTFADGAVLSDVKEKVDERR